MTEEKGQRISEAVRKLMETQFPDTGFMIVASDTNHGGTMLVTGNACAVCITKGLILEIMHGNLKHLDGHSDENIFVMDLTDNPNPTKH